MQHGHKVKHDFTWNWHKTVTPVVTRLSDLGKRAEETQDIDLHQAARRARVCDDYMMQPAADADNDDHDTCINVKFPLTLSCLTFFNLIMQQLSRFVY